MKTSHLTIALLMLSCVAATFLVYVTFLRYPVRSATAAVQWVLLYAATVLYPVGWTMQHRRVVSRLGLAQSPELGRLTWAPMIVGGTSLLLSLSLLWGASR
jgi:hypothetical protein